MSFRSAVRLTRTIRPTGSLSSRVPTIARRANSSGGHAKPGSDMPWVLGSAAVFVPLTAWILMPGQDHSHHPHSPSHSEYAEDQHGNTGIESTHETTPQLRDAKEELDGGGHEGDDEGDDEGTKQGGGEGEPSEKSVMDSLKQSVKSNAPKLAMSDDSGDKGGDESGSSSDDDSDEDGMSAQAIKDSLQRSESVANPRVAMSHD